MKQIKKKLMNPPAQLMCFPEGSRDHANPTVQQEKDLEKKMTDISGRKCLEQLERFSHVGLWAKTFSALLIGQEGWYSTKCKLTWKLRGTKYGRMYFQLAASTPPIKDTGPGLLPTPNSTDWKGKFRRMQAIRNYLSGGHQIHLTEVLVGKGLTYKEVMNTYEEIMGYPIGWTELKHSEML